MIQAQLKFRLNKSQEITLEGWLWMSHEVSHALA